MSTIIDQFYIAFQNLDGTKMAECYHDHIEFYDPAFGNLKGSRAKSMWKMLCESQKGKDFKVRYSDVVIENNQATAKWEAFYTFSKTNRRVHNRIDASFELRDGKIIKHMDQFNLYKWSKQALGLKGWLLGKTDFFKEKLQAQTNRLLDNYEAKQS